VKFKAVIFDLFGTLVENFSAREYANLHVRLAETLGVPADAFARIWKATSDERFKGDLNTTEDYLMYVCGKLGADVADAQIKRAADIRFDYTARQMTPRPGAVETLSALKSRGYKLGLISDCSSEAPKVWPDTPFAALIDVAIFSCVVGLKKPNPRIYRLAAERLGVKPEECLYVGDGDSQELTGAAQVGMNPVLIRVPDNALGSPDETLDAYRLNAQEWSGPTVMSLTEVLALAV